MRTNAPPAVTADANLLVPSLPRWFGLLFYCHVMVTDVGSGL